MPKPYTLRLFSGVASASSTAPTQTFIADLTAHATDWRRSTRAIGGFWQGSFTLEGNAADLQAAFDTWLGCHVEERTGGAVSWEGLVYEMDFTHAGIKRRRSFDLMYNAVKTSYVMIDWLDENLVDNGSFETGAAGSFDNWTSGLTGDPGVETELVIINDGTQSCKITYDGIATGVDGVALPDNCYIKQAVDVTTGDVYKLTLSTNGLARIAIRKPSAPTAWLRVLGGVGSVGHWDTRSINFVGPEGSEVVLWLWSGVETDDVAYFDSVSIVGRGEVVAETEWKMMDGNTPTVIVTDSTQCPSVVRYGRREEILYLDDYPLASATARAETFLAESSYPWARPVSAGEPGDTVLEVRVAGYVHTANWQFVTECDGTEKNLSTWLASIVGINWGLGLGHGGPTPTAGDCQFLRIGSIDGNALQVVAQNTVRQRAWDTITELLELGIAGTNPEPAYMPARAWVGPGRALHYAKVDRSPRYYLRGNGLYDKAGGRVAVSPWAVQPAVFRDMTYPVRRDLTGSFLEDARDFWVEEIEVDATGRTLFKTSQFSEQDALEARFGWFGPGEPVDPLAPRGQRPPTQFHQ